MKYRETEGAKVRRLGFALDEATLKQLAYSKGITQSYESMTQAQKAQLRYVAMIIWIYSAWRGLQLAYEHPMIQLHPSPFMTCDFAARFPSWLPLDKWLPQVFLASGDCAERQWSFLTLEMPQWLLGIFAAYLVVAVLVVIAQPFKPKKRDLIGR